MNCISQLVSFCKTKYETRTFSKHFVEFTIFQLQKLKLITLIKVD